MKRVIYLLIGCALLVAALTPATLRLTASADLGAYDFADLSQPQIGAARFTFYDWGGLNAATLRTNGVPWKLSQAVLALHAGDGDVEAAIALNTADLYRPFGFHVPDQIANWPEGMPAPALNGPLGIVRGQSAGFTPASIEIANTGCAACHSAPVYRADGTPDVGAVWIGGSNASLNLQAYTDTLFEGFLAFGDTQALWDVTKGRFPDITLREQATLRVLLPVLMGELEQRQNSNDQLFPFAPSHIGATNGYDALRLRLGLIDQDSPVTQSYFTSIPAVGDRAWRSRFLSNGVYALPDVDQTSPTTRTDLTDERRTAQAKIVSYFIVPSMGMTAEAAIDQHAAAEDVMAWIAGFTPQPFPAPVDLQSAALGRTVFGYHCASCHGTYDQSLDRPSLVAFPNWDGDVGTYLGPPLELFEEVADAVNTSAYAPYLTVQPQRLRFGPPLAGLWASAPYLANGSVPTLWHLMRPDTRPERFAIGGHALDMDRVGIALNPPDGYVPWAGIGVIDTTQDGFSNAGHAAPFDVLTESEKAALLDYLKLL